MVKSMIADENAWYKKVVPQKVRRMISNPLADRIAAVRYTRPLEKKPKRYRPGKYPAGINLYGLLRSEIGLAQGAKLYAKALEIGGIPHTLLNVDYFDDLPQEDATFDDRLTKENKYAINVAHINPPEWRAVMGGFPQEQFDGHYNIGIFQWELETVPDEWVSMFDYVDEVWTPSAFTARTMSKVTKKPVIPVLYGMEAPFDDTLTRGDFGLSDEDFLVLMMFDSKSFASRKNPGGAIDAFREAFGEKAEHVKLVIKINNPKEEDIAFVEEHLGGAEYVMITERMDKPRLNSLIRLCDVFISLHRAVNPLVVVVDRHAQGTLRAFLPNDVFIQRFLHLRRGKQVHLAGHILARRSLVQQFFFVQDLVAHTDAFVTDEHIRAGHEPLHHALFFSAEGAARYQAVIIICHLFPSPLWPLAGRFRR